ncbi:MAG TPA: uroporphyrinogen decarboxylase family protein [Planctomycetota bacterium]|nr:uroporphyrinogen decarboxylase family protein [Planctomycetota bacterium]
MPIDLRKHQPDFGQFLKALRRQGRPAHLPFYEHVASSGFMAERLGKPVAAMGWTKPGYHRAYADFWLGMGFDCVPMEISLRIKLPEGHGGLSEGSEAMTCIRTMDDFERFPWPKASDPLELRHFEEVGRGLPDGARIVGGVACGPYEWVSMMMGVMGLSYALVDCPELVARMFGKFRELHVGAVKLLAQLDCVGALRQGDDLGFKTSTFLPPEVLREHVFPTYRDMAAAAHAAGKPFLLHSCGNLGEVYEDLVGCGIDGKHSFEDGILPVAEFKRLYGRRITPLGGMDVDFLCRSSADQVRAAARRMVEDCYGDGHWAMGTGNSLPDYMPVANYVAALEAAREAAG